MTNVEHQKIDDYGCYRSGPTEIGRTTICTLGAVCNVRATQEGFATGNRVAVADAACVSGSPLGAATGPACVSKDEDDVLVIPFLCGVQRLG